jgi:hypothetical protein
MKTLPWSRDAAVESVRAEIWRYVSAASRREELVLQAAALLGMPAAEIRSLAQIQFVTSDEVGELLDAMPDLSRRPTTTTEAAWEQSADRVRGTPQWGPTYGARAATGNPMVYVTAPARRAYQTPENELVVFLLDAIARVAQHTRWAASDSEWAGRLVRERHDEAVRWRGVRVFQEVQVRPTISPGTIARVRKGRAARRFAVAVKAWQRYHALVDQVDPVAVREAVEQHGLVTRLDETLLELQVLFGVERALGDSGWSVGDPRLVAGGGPVLAASRGDEQLEVFFQCSPSRATELTSVYRSVQKSHGFARALPIRPDLIFRHRFGDRTRWVLLEVKGGTGRVEAYARAALQNLLAYRQDAGELFPEGAVEPFGLGVAWGAELVPMVDGPIALCTPDTLGEAVGKLFADAAAGEVATPTG